CNKGPLACSRRRNIGTHEEGTIVALFDLLCAGVRGIRQVAVGDYYIVSVIDTIAVGDSPPQGQTGARGDSSYRSIRKTGIGNVSAAGYYRPGARANCRNSGSHREGTIVALLL